MTGRSNSATTSRKMWMLSASSARRWSRRRSAVTSGDKATVDIDAGTTEAVPYKNKKARDFVPGFGSALSVSGCYPNSCTPSAGTVGTMLQQAQVQQQFERTTVPGFDPKTDR